MALAHTILAALISQSRSGYDLTKYFETSIGFFWKASHQQIYRELSKLEEQGWIAAEAIAQAGRPDKKLYHLTELGLHHLMQWTAKPCDAAALKDDLLVKVFVGNLVPVSAIQSELKRHRQIHQEKLATYETIQQQYFQHPQQLSNVNVFPYLTLRRGIRYEQEWVDWCDEALELLAKRSDDEPV